MNDRRLRPCQSGERLRYSDGMSSNVSTYERFLTLYPLSSGSLGDIARALGISRARVHQHLEQALFEGRVQRRKLRCVQCGADFYRDRKARRCPTCLEAEREKVLV